MAEHVTLTAILSVKDKMSSALQNAERATGGLGSRFKSMVGAGAAMQVGMRAVNTAISTISGSMDAAISRADTLNQFPKLMNQMGLASEKAADKVKDGLVKSIEGLPTSLDEIVSSTKNLAVLTGDLDSAADTAVALNDAFLASGSSSADASRGLTQYSQMLAKGKVDQQSWNTLCETMGYGLDKTAKSMLGAEANQRDLYSALQSGKITFDDFNKELIKLDKAEGGFADTARTASVGIATSMSNIRTAITAGLANSIDALDKAMKDSGVKWLEGGIAGTLDNVKTAVSGAFKSVNKAISSVNIKGIVDGLTPAFKVLKTAATGAFKAISGILGFLNKHAEGTAKAATGVAALVMAYGGYKKISKFKDGLSGVTRETKTFEKPANLAAEGTYKLKSGLGSLAKMAGVAAIISSLALLAKSMTGLASLGTTAVAPLVTFGVVVAGLAAVFAGTGKMLQTSAIGIGVFAASVSAMAYTMSLIASTGRDGAVAMGVFGIVVAGLAAVFALLGPALTAGAIGIAVLGVSVALIGYGLKQATPFVTAFGNVVEQAGNAVSVAAEGIGNGFLKISEGAAMVVDAISGGFSKVLDSVAGVINSVGNSAKKAGTGFKLVAEGIKTIAGLSIGSVAKSLAAVATGLAAISSGGKKIPKVAQGLQTLVAAMRAAGNASGSGFSSGIQKGMSSAVTAGTQAVKKINAALKSGASGAKSAGRYISQGFANGMLSCLGTIESAADRMVSAANKAIEAKAKIHSPSKVTEDYGQYYGEGWVNGIKDRYRQAKKAAENLMSVPQVKQQKFALAGAYNENYMYGGNRSFTVEVPVMMDGKEVARVTAPYTEAELNRRQTRADRKKGVR